MTDDMLRVMKWHNGDLRQAQLIIREVLGAEMRIGDYKSTVENGIPKVVRSFAWEQWRRPLAWGHRP